MSRLTMWLNTVLGGGTLGVIAANDGGDAFSSSFRFFSALAVLWFVWAANDGDYEGVGDTETKEAALKRCPSCGGSAYRWRSGGEYDLPDHSGKCCCMWKACGLGGIWIDVETWDALPRGSNTELLDEALKELKYVETSLGAQNKVAQNWRVKRAISLIERARTPEEER